MGKVLNLKAAMGGALCCALAAQSAAAQSASNPQLLSTGLKETFSASDVSSIMSEYSIQTVLAPYQDDDVAVVLATTSGGAHFRIAMFVCEDPATGTDCGAAAMFTGLSNAGVSYDDINTFHTKANVTRAVNVSAQNIIIFGTQMFFKGGIGRENFKLITELFLNDVQNYVNASAAATTVSMRRESEKRGKVDNIAQSDDDAIQPP